MSTKKIRKKPKIIILKFTDSEVIAINELLYDYLDNVNESLLAGDMKAEKIAEFVHSVIGSLNGDSSTPVSFQGLDMIRDLALDELNFLHEQTEQGLFSSNLSSPKLLLDSVVRKITSHFQQANVKVVAKNS